MIASRLTSKARITVPKAVRDALDLQEGDDLAYEIGDGRVTLTKARALVPENPFATFEEWDSKADHRAYNLL